MDADCGFDRLNAGRKIVDIDSDRYVPDINADFELEGSAYLNSM